jgi:hypothetical protein
MHHILAEPLGAHFDDPFSTQLVDGYEDLVPREIGAFEHNVIQRRSGRTHNDFEHLMFSIPILISHESYLLTIRKRVAHMSLQVFALIIERKMSIRWSSVHSSDRCICIQVNLDTFNVAHPAPPARSYSRFHRTAEAIGSHHGILDTPAIDAACGVVECISFDV